MSSELERRLEGLLAEAPEPEAGAGEEALHRALQALRPIAPARRALRTAIVVFAAALVLLAIAAGSLAAAGALHVSFGAKPKPKPRHLEVSRALTLPPRAGGLAAVVDGRLSVVTRSGFRLQGLPVSSAALSPHSLYVAAGIGRSLVAMAPDGKRAWSHAAGGIVVAIAWAPDGLRIAYVVRAGGGFALHVIYGNGIHDTTIDRSVRAVRPSWRADSLAFAYVGAGGKAIVYDLAHASRSVVGAAAPVTHVAFAPVGTRLAVATPEAVLVDRKTVVRARVEALGWLYGRLAVAVPGLGSALIHSFAPDGASRGSHRVSGTVVAITSKHVVVQTKRDLVAGRTPLLGVRPGTSVGDLAIR